ncbi:hypothetical protein [Faecalibaculum rodentium]|jgi:hypothetical protein|uniref:hypothetical protein n=1 Tax=Faecalibaculum rodentium TaxID=1702221 RepID=UPI001C3DA0ED|nr:hypothetical protein [Faecalibaculum rodentium]
MKKSKEAFGISPFLSWRAANSGQNTPPQSLYLRKPAKTPSANCSNGKGKKAAGFSVFLPFFGFVGIESSRTEGKRQFLRARFYHGAKIRISAVLPLRKSCWGVPSPNPAMRLAPLKNPQNFFSGFSKTVPLHTLFFSY